MVDSNLSLCAGMITRGNKEIFSRIEKWTNLSLAGGSLFKGFTVMARRVLFKRHDLIDKGVNRSAACATQAEELSQKNLLQSMFGTCEVKKV